jgi:pimeloyl-ACP methyl ester carboxylesterase
MLAMDQLAVMDAVGWTKDAPVHVVGTSMGGMIAQEMARIAPGRIKSLALCATYAGMFFRLGVSVLCVLYTVCTLSSRISHRISPCNNMTRSPPSARVCSKRNQAMDE